MLKRPSFIKTYTLLLFVIYNKSYNISVRNKSYSSKQNGYIVIQIPT